MGALVIGSAARLLRGFQFSPEAHQPAVCEITPAARAALVSPGLAVGPSGFYAS